MLSFLGYPSERANVPTLGANPKLLEAVRLSSWDLVSKPLDVVSQKYFGLVGRSPNPFARDFEHFGSQTDAERPVKNHRLSEGLKARLSVL